LALFVQRRSGLRATIRASIPRRTRIHREKGELRLDARVRLRGKGVNEHRGALRFRATRDNRGNDTTCRLLPWRWAR